MSENTEVQSIGTEEVGNVNDVLGTPEVTGQAVEAVTGDIEAAQIFTDEVVAIEPTIDAVEESVNMEVVAEVVEVAPVEEIVAEPVVEVVAIEPVIEVAPEVVVESTVEVAPEVVAESVAEPFVEVAPEVVAESVAEPFVEVAPEVAAEPVPEVAVEVPVTAEEQNPVIITAVTDTDGVLIVGGSTSDGKAYLMKKYEDGRECPTLTFGSNNRSVNVIYLEMKDMIEGGYDIICGCLDDNGRINIIRCDSDLNVLRAVHVNKDNSYINAISKWDDIFLLSVVYENTEKEIKSAIIACDSEFNVIGATDVNISVPEGYEVIDPKTPLVTMLTTLVPNGDTLIIGGSVRMPDISYGVIALVDSNFNSIKACTLTIGDKKYTALHNLTVNDDIIEVMCIFTTSEQEQPMSITKQFNMDLEEVVVIVEEEIQITKTTTEVVVDGESIKIAETITEVDIEVDGDFEKGYK